MKKILLPAAFLCLMLSSCISVKPVVFRRTENFSVSSNNNSPLLNFGIVFYNPNAFGCIISDIESEGTLRNQQIFIGGMKTRVKVKSKSEFAVPVAAKISKMDFSQLLGAGINLLLNDQAIQMKVKGKIKMKKCLFTKTYEFDYTQAIDKTQLKKLF